MKSDIIKGEGGIWGCELMILEREYQGYGANGYNSG